MDVVIINQELNRDKQYQIMIPINNGFNHMYSGKLFTLEQAKELCKQNNLNVTAIGTIWQCIK